MVVNVGCVIRMRVGIRSFFMFLVFYVFGDGGSNCFFVSFIIYCGNDGGSGFNCDFVYVFKSVCMDFSDCSFVFGGFGGNLFVCFG